MKTHNQMLSEWMRDPEFKEEYDALEKEFALFDAGGGSEQHSPSIATLQRYAEAVGCRLEIRLVRN